MLWLPQTTPHPEVCVRPRVPSMEVLDKWVMHLSSHMVLFSMLLVVM
jgi:hypothetical protein